MFLIFYSARHGHDDAVGLGASEGDRREPDRTGTHQARFEGRPDGQPRPLVAPPSQLAEGIHLRVSQ